MSADTASPVNTWMFYDPKTGVFADRTYTGLRELLAHNTPQGLVAFEGSVDYLSQRVDMDSVNVARAAALEEHRSRVEQDRAKFVPLESMPGRITEFAEPPFEFMAAQGHLIDYQPPQPDSDHEWNATARRWVLSKQALERTARRQEAQARIDALERRQARRVRELLAASDPQLKAMDDEIAGLRADL